MTWDNRLTFEERKKIEKLIKTGMSAGRISLAIGRSKNIAIVEIRRSGGRENYNAADAQRMSAERHEKRRQNQKKNFEKNPLPNPYTLLKNEIDALNMQIEIIMQIITKKDQ